MASPPIPTTSAASARARRAAAGPAPTPWSPTRWRWPRWCAPAIPACRSTWSARAWAARWRWSPPTAALEVDGLMLSAAALRSRDTFGPVGKRGPVVFRPHHPVVTERSDLDRLPANRQSQDPGEAAERSDDAAPARMDMGYGLVDLMDAARASAERVHLPYLMLHGLGDRLVPQSRCIPRSRSCRRAAIRSSPSTSKAITCCCATRRASSSPRTSSPGSPNTKRRCLPARRHPFAARDRGTLGIEAQPLGRRQRDPPVQVQRTTTEAGPRTLVMSPRMGMFPC